MENQRRWSSNLSIGELLAETRDLVRSAAGLAREPVPDSFLGRKTQEPFPKEIRESNLRHGAPRSVMSRQRE
jgi:hypothetical protein